MEKTQRDEGVISQSPPLERVGSYDEKASNHVVQTTELTDFERNRVEEDLHVTEQDLADAKVYAASVSLEDARELMTTVLELHEYDTNFPRSTIERIRAFLSNEAVFENPEKHEEIIWEMKLEAGLITGNSPYAEVRAVVDNKDDPNMPCSTVRAWTLGILLSALISLINQLFEIRYPPVYVDNNVAQLVAYPMGVAWAKWMPNAVFRVAGKEIELNPGPFNKKEHMIITIMASIAKSVPYTQYIVFTQTMPFMFNQQYAHSFSYQILIALSTNFVGYGLAGLARRFLVYPSFCIWPHSLVSIALNGALHNDGNDAVPGPFKKMYTMSRYKFFLLAFGAMFIWFWIPEVLFNGLQTFSWMSWISPTNPVLSTVVGNHGFGLFNPMPTWDWNVVIGLGNDPLMLPGYATFSMVGGCFVACLIALGMYYSNTWNTGYLPPLSNKVFDDTAGRYNVSRILDDRGFFDLTKYMDYSAAYLGAANSLLYGAFFASYSALVTYVGLFHWRDLRQGFRGLWRQIRRQKDTQGEGKGEYQDVHMRLMKQNYKEVSEWWYLLVVVVAAAFGFAGIASQPTHTTLAVVPYGIIMCLVMMVPIGIVKAMTGIELTMNVLAEFIGGMWVSGNALAMNFFKSYGYVTCAHAVHFSNDLKLAHYLKIAPWYTFIAQMLATLISTFVTTGIMRWQISLPDVCTENAPMKFTCPGINTFFTASVLWGSIGPDKVFGHTGQYKLLLWGWFFGMGLVFVFWLAVRRWKGAGWLRNFHPVTFCMGSLNLAPYSFSYFWPAVPAAWLSWVYVRGRWLGFWSKYNFVLSAAWSAGVAVSAVVIFFAVKLPGAEIDWWGNSITGAGCAGEIDCSFRTLADGERFKPWWDPTVQPAPGL